MPDFLLILTGWVICRSALDRPAWEAVERLVYSLLFPVLPFFPVLLFNSIVRSALQPAQTLSLASAGCHRNRASS